MARRLSRSHLMRSLRREDNASNADVWEEEVRERDTALRTEMIPYVNVKDYGAVGNNSSDDTGAIARAFDAASDAAIYFPDGTYLTDPITNIAAGATILGDSPYRSIIKSRTGGNVISLSGTVLNGLEIARLGIAGNGGSGHGISIDFSTYAHNLNLHDLRVLNCGGKGIYAPKQFAGSFKNMTISGVADNGIALGAANTTILQNIFVGTVGEGKCGFRMYASPTMICCNGLTGAVANSDWGVFGRNVAEDGALTYSWPVLIGCNIENFYRYGCRFKQESGGSFMGCVISTPTTGSVVALRYDTNPQGVNIPIWVGGRCTLNGSCTWQNGFAIEATGRPFFSFGSQFSSFWSHNYSMEIPMGVFESDYGWPNNHISLSLGSIERCKNLAFRESKGLTANSTTPSVENYNIFHTQNTQATPYTNFLGGVEGKRITIFVDDANSSFDFTDTNLKGNGAVDWSPSEGDWFEGIFDGTNWRCAVHELS